MKNDSASTLGKLIEWVKLPFGCIVTVALVGSVTVLFGGEDFVQQLCLQDFRTQYGQWIGIVFLLTAGLLVCYIIISLKTAVLKLRNHYLRKHRGKIMLNSLSDVEIRLVLQVYNSLDFCTTLNANDPIVSRLVKKGILYIGERQLISYDWYYNRFPCKCTLQSYIIRTLDNYNKEKIHRIQVLDDRISRCKSDSKRKRLDSQISMLKSIFDSKGDIIQWIG